VEALGELELVALAAAEPAALRADPALALAARRGVTRESLNRALSGLPRRGWVRQDEGGYLLTDPAALRPFALS
jgi:DNA-binding IclR family transcriptional regulator